MKTAGAFVIIEWNRPSHAFDDALVKFQFNKNYNSKFNGCSLKKRNDMTIKMLINRISLYNLKKEVNGVKVSSIRKSIYT